MKYIGGNSVPQDSGASIQSCRSEYWEFNFTGTATVRDVRADRAETFWSICLQLDHYKNWQALGQKIGIPHEKLQQISTSSSCTKTVLDIIEKRKPELTVKEMKTVLKDMQRQDVCVEVNKLSGKILLQFSSLASFAKCVND